MKIQSKRLAAAARLTAAGIGAGATPVHWAVVAGGNDHGHEIVSLPDGPGSLRQGWATARADALLRTHLGLTGLLATVRSVAEKLLLDSLVRLHRRTTAGSAA